MEVKAYAIDSLVSLGIPGLSQICRRINKQGVPLAYELILNTKRDTVEVKILIGNNLVNFFMNWEDKPKKCCGQFLFPTHYVWCPSGKIPYTRKAISQQSVNLLVANVATVNPDREMDIIERVNVEGIMDGSSIEKNHQMAVSKCQRKNVVAPVSAVSNQ